MDNASPRPGLTWWSIALVFALTWVVILVVFLPVEREKVGGPADYGWKLLDLNDAPVDFARFKGKTVFLNIWATWCPPCVREMPSIARLAANPRLKDVAFLCVSTDDSAATVREFLRDKDWKMTVLRATEVPPPYATDGIPATFIITADGRVVFAEVGAAEWDSPENVDRLERLVEETKVKP